MSDLKQLPWFIVALPSQWGWGTDNGFVSFRIFTSHNVPESISSSQPLNYSDKKVPGGGSSLTGFGSVGAEKLSFSLKTARFNDEFEGGATDIVQFFKSLRRAPTMTMTHEPFKPNPKVLYCYGTGSVPLIYYVTKADVKTSRPNKYGAPQVVDVSLELVVDSSSPLYRMELAFQTAMTLVNMGRGIESVLRASRGNPYYGETLT